MGVANYEFSDYLPRLEPGHYRGQAYVHWNMTIQDRRTGWLIPAFNYKFRELLTHAAFRYSFTCPIYCLMPDHIHMLWIGIDDRTDQLRAMKYFRRELSRPLLKLGFEFQHQPYDRVLRDNERLESAVETVVEYIARNPERQGLVPPDGYRKYRYSGCLIPGYPGIELWQPDFWQRFWRSYSYMRRHGRFHEARRSPVREMGISRSPARGERGLERPGFDV